MSNIISTFVALAVSAALAGCGGVEVRSPLVFKSSPAAQKTTPMAPAQAVKPTTPAPASAPAPIAASAAAPLFTTNPWKWEHPGTARFAKTRAEAMQKREGAFRKLGFSGACIPLLMKATEQPGEQVILKNGDRFAAQISKGDVVHGLKEGGGIVAFKTPMPGLDWTAPAERWSVTCEGRIETVDIPAVCFNITKGIPVPAPAPLASCTNTGWIFEMRAYSEQTLPEVLHKQAAGLIAAASAADSEASRTPQRKSAEMYKGDRLSRVMGESLYKQVKPTGDFGNRVLLLDPSTFDVSEDLGVVPVVGGVGRITLTDVQHLKVVKTVWPKEKVKSPTLSGDENQNWFFPAEWQSEKGNRCIPRIVSGISVP